MGAKEVLTLDEEDTVDETADILDEEVVVGIVEDLVEDDLTVED